MFRNLSLLNLDKHIFAVDLGVGPRLIANLLTIRLCGDSDLVALLSQSLDMFSYDLFCFLLFKLVSTNFKYVVLRGANVFSFGIYLELLLLFVNRKYGFLSRIVEASVTMLQMPFAD